ncbi:MAG TPA: amino acid-binding protein [Marmoricola sp.]|nr:amino acid-binding protein [Marmoricola sp.]
MTYLLRVQLPDVPGSLGRLATAIGTVGGNINAIEIVEHAVDGTAVDDVFIEAEPGVMPDSVVSAVNQLEGVQVLWISRYGAGGNLFLDLEAVESMTQDPTHAARRLVEILPVVFRVDWGMRVRRDGEHAVLVDRTSAAPAEIPDGLRWRDLSGAERLDLEPWPDLLMAACPLDKDQVVIIARRGGPEILDSEIARLAHLVALAGSISRR